MGSIPPEAVAYQQAHAYQNLQPNIYGAYAANTVLAYLAVGLRLYARKRSAAGFSWDDGLIIGALITYTGYFICAMVQTDAGNGKHIIFLKNAKNFATGFVGSIIFYAVTVIFIKASVLCFYCRIFYSRNLVRVCWAFGVFVFCYNLALIIIDLVQCVPLRALWADVPGKCFNVAISFMVLGSINAFTDFLLLIIPLRKILSLKLNTSRKFQLCGIFILGGAVTIFGVVRVAVHHELVETDLSYSSTWPGIWSDCELAMGIVCACLPTLAGLVNKLQMSARAKSMYQYLRSSFSTDRSLRSNGSDDSNGVKAPISESSSDNEKHAFAPKRSRHHYRIWAEAPRKKPTSISKILDTTISGDGQSDYTRSVHEGEIVVQTEVEQRVEHH